jgi:hypothetical protein
VRHLPRIVWIAIAAAILASLIAVLPYATAYTLSPDTIRGWADDAVRAERPAIARWLLRPLAGQGDAIAQNNLAVLMFLQAMASRRATSLDAVEALLRQAAGQRLERAKLNLVTIQWGRCHFDGVANARAAISLSSLLRNGDEIAGSQLLDCLYFNDTRAKKSNANELIVRMTDDVLATGSSDLMLKAGISILNFARTTPSSPAKANQEAYNKTVAPLAEASKRLLFAAAQAGQPAAYEWIGILSQQMSQHLGTDPQSIAVRGKTMRQWIETGGKAGDWNANCHVAENSLQRVINSGAISGEAFDAALLQASACIEWQGPERGNAEDEKVYLAYRPRPPHEATPPPTWHAVKRLVEDLKFRRAYASKS